MAAKNQRGVGVGAGDLRALDRLTDAQLAAVELMVYHGLWASQIARRLLLDVETVRRWLREPLFAAAVIELQRAYAAAQLVPFGLYRIREEMARPDAKLRELVQATRFAAELAGYYLTGAPEAGAYAPGQATPGRPLAEMSRAELERLAAVGQARLDAWSAAQGSDPLA
jgi:hypothetical protein